MAGQPTLHKGRSIIEDNFIHKGYYDDLRFPVASIRLGGAQPPTDVAYKGGLALEFPSNTDKTIYLTAQFPHGAVMGQDPEFHTHIAIPVSGACAGAENLKWDLTYSWSGIGGVFPSESTLSITYDLQNTVADTHTLIDVGDLLYSNRSTGSEGVSDVIICSLTRDVSVASDYASSVYLITADFHILLDRVGSRYEYLK